MEDLLLDGTRFYGFCRNDGADAFGDSVIGKPVVNFEHLAFHKENSHVIFAREAIPQIISALQERGFSRDHILFYSDSLANIKTNQYL